MRPGIDAHLHVVSGDEQRYPRRPRGFARDWWTGRPVDVAAVLAALDGAGVERGVIVQAVGPYGTDNRYAIDAVAAHADRCALVVAIDADGTDPAAELRALVGAGPCAGVRVFAAGGEAVWLADGRADAIWAAAAAAGVPLVVACLAAQLAPLGAVVGRHPGVTMALDHCGFADLSDGPPFARATPLWSLAAHPGVHLKITTNTLVAAGAAAPAFVTAAVARFGADRVAWGSDHPQHYETGYADMVALAERATASLASAERRSVLHDTAARLFFPTPSAT